ncbi:MAG: 5-formyltetrahydrofolate cyclo-ligase [Verrucomicrobiales bacterium]|nr:5-formyltetrahydrofolate cyclo-ligase [Verrucomicrobiales bacterium]
MDKQLLRREGFATIEAIKPEEKASASVAICRQLADTRVFRKAEVIFAYLSMTSEPTLESLFSTYPQKRWGFSRINDEGLLEFHHVTGISQVAVGEYGIFEPDPKQCKKLTPEEVNLILVPGVAFDASNGARLGRGRGHYDRYLAKVASTPEPAHIMGVCFANQLTSLNPEEHDVPMDRIITEKGIVQHVATTNLIDPAGA